MTETEADGRAKRFTQTYERPWGRNRRSTPVSILSESHPYKQYYNIGHGEAGSLMFLDLTYPERNYQGSDQLLSPLSIPSHLVREPSVSSGPRVSLRPSVADSSPSFAYPLETTLHLRLGRRFPTRPKFSYVRCPSSYKGHWIPFPSCSVPYPI